MEEVGGGQATIAGCLGWWVGVRVTELNALVWMPGSWNACAGGVAGWWVRGGMRMRSASRTMRHHMFIWAACVRRVSLAWCMPLEVIARNSQG
jgi:hypothetical protein